MANCAHPHPSPDSQMQIESAPSVNQQLPGGHCNFRDLNQGTPQSTCGCRRFWLNTQPSEHGNTRGMASPRVYDQAWCFCGHHACFHEFALQSSSPLRKWHHDTHHQEPNKTIHGGRHVNPPSAIPDFPSHTGFTNTSSFAKYGSINPANLHINPKSDAQDGYQVTHQPVDQYVHQHRQERERQNAAQIWPRQSGPDSEYEDYIAAGLGVYLGNDNELEPIGPATQLTRKPFSKASTENISLRHSHSRSITRTENAQADSQQNVSQHFMKQVVGLRHAASSAPPLINGRHDGDEIAQSVTEVATPSMMGTPALKNTDETIESIKAGIDQLNDIIVSPDAVTRSSLQISVSGHNVIDQLLQKLTALKTILVSNPNLATSIGKINNRLDALECASFGHSSVEDMQDKLELFDSRLIELEEKVEELEKNNALADHGRQYHSFAVSMPRRANESFTSSNSNRPVDLGIEASGEVQVFDRIQHAESRLRLLNNITSSTHPSRAIKLVLIPWGRELNGLWCSTKSGPQADSTLLTQNSEEWISTNNTRGVERITNSDIEVYGPGWYNDFNSSFQISMERLSPRACAESSVIYQRLKSRGFVQEVVYHESGSIQSLIQGAFKHLESLFLGSNLLPLRKIHKASRLEFLSPSEIESEHLWNTEFLDSDVAMKAAGGTRTLFMTNASGYLQRPESPGDTWQKLRELPRFIPNHSSSGSRIEEANAAEPCWAWNSRLDPPISVHSSASEHLKRSAHSSFMSHPLSPQQTDRSPSPRSADEIRVSDSENLADFTDNNSSRPGPTTPMSDGLLSLPKIRSPQASQFRRTISLPLAATSQSQNQQLPKRYVTSFDNQVCSPTAIQVPLKLDQKRRRLSRTPEANIMAWGLTPRRSREPPSPGEQDQLDQDIEIAERRTIQNTGAAYDTPFSNNPPSTQQHIGQSGNLGSTEQKRKASGTGGDTSSGSAQNERAEDDEVWEGVEDEDIPDKHADGHINVGFSNDMDLDDGVVSSSTSDDDDDDDDDYEGGSEGDESMAASDEDYQDGDQIEHAMDDE